MKTVLNQLLVYSPELISECDRMLTASRRTRIHAEKIKYSNIIESDMTIIGWAGVYWLGKHTIRDPNIIL